MTTQITTGAFEHILKTAGSRAAESGGLLLGSREDNVVRYFLFDKDAKTTSTSYTFNAPYLNEMLQKLWDEKKLELLGFCHTHPTSYKELSEQDKRYFKEQFEHMDVDMLLTPLMFTAKDGAYDFIPYVTHRDGRVEKTTLEILPDTYHRYTTSPDENLKNISKKLTLILEKLSATQSASKTTQIEAQEELVYQDDFVLFLNHFPFKKFRTFLWNGFLLVLTLVSSALLLDIFLTAIPNLLNI